MSNFWKLWGSIAGSVVGIVFAILAVYGVAQCTGTDVGSCTVLGFGAAQVTATLTALGAALGTVFAPANSG